MLRYPVSHDVQIFADGGWQTVSSCRTRTEAIRKAQALDIGPACQAVRVLCKTYDRRTGRIGHETLIRRTFRDPRRLAALRADLANARPPGKGMTTREPVDGAKGTGGRPLFSTLGIRTLAVLTCSAAAIQIVQRIVT